MARAGALGQRDAVDADGRQRVKQRPALLVGRVPVTLRNAATVMKQRNAVCRLQGGDGLPVPRLQERGVLGRNDVRDTPVERGMRGGAEGVDDVVGVCDV